jgi:site-specific DNA-methyltransferase (adenine-specific)/site-specific DNA-methyltransferase (cytosine-N4-specific)
MYQEEVMVPMGDWAKNRLRNLSETDKIRDNSKVAADLEKTFQTGWTETKHIQLMSYY